MCILNFLVIVNATVLQLQLRLLLALCGGGHADKILFVYKYLYCLLCAVFDF